jgi:hypothetical protein
MTVRATLVRASLLAVAGLLFSCEAVPELTFAVRDAEVDADAGADAEAGTCGGPSPPAAPYVCCGPNVCQGPCDDECDLCMSKCAPDQVCCAKNNNVVCTAAGMICH